MPLPRLSALLAVVLLPPAASAPEKEKKADPPPASVAPRGVIAATGFNARKGLGTGGGAAPPYPVGKANALGGFGERGWSGAWPAHERAEYVALRA